jgi:hypothetical protein
MPNPTIAFTCGVSQCFFYTFQLLDTFWHLPKRSSGYFGNLFALVNCTMIDENLKRCILMVDWLLIFFRSWSCNGAAELKILNQKPDGKPLVRSMFELTFAKKCSLARFKKCLFVFGILHQPFQ